jgi:hypothetical protein
LLEDEVRVGAAIVAAQLLARRFVRGKQRYYVAAFAAGTKTHGSHFAFARCSDDGPWRSDPFNLLSADMRSIVLAEKRNVMPKKSIFLIAIAIAILVMGAALLAGGLWLISLHGSWFYAIAGFGLISTSILLFRQDDRALWLFAVLTIGTLVWSGWEVGLDWWPLAARGDVIFVVGLLLLTPWISRGLVRGGSPELARESAPTSRGGRWALAVTLGVALVVAIASWMTDAHQITPDGARNAELQAAGASDRVPPANGMLTGARPPVSVMRRWTRSRPQTPRSLRSRGPTIPATRQDAPEIPSRRPSRRRR